MPPVIWPQQQQLQLLNGSFPKCVSNGHSLLSEPKRGSFGGVRFRIVQSLSMTDCACKMRCSYYDKHIPFRQPARSASGLSDCSKVQDSHRLPLPQPQRSSPAPWTPTKLPRSHRSSRAPLSTRRGSRIFPICSKPLSVAPYSSLPTRASASRSPVGPTARKSGTRSLAHSHRKIARK